MVLYAAPAPPGRQRILIDADWRFQMDASAALTNASEVRAWRWRADNATRDAVATLAAPCVDRAMNAPAVGENKLMSTTYTMMASRFIRRALWSLVVQQVCIGFLIAHPASGNASGSHFLRVASYNQDSDKTPTTPEEADKLERKLKQHPDDSNTRMLLLEYYYWQMIQSPSAHVAHERHVLWVIRNYPDADIAGVPAMSLVHGREDDAIAKAKRLWQQQVSAHPKNARLLGNAATFFLKQGLETGFELLNRAQTLEPKNPHWPMEQGMIYSEWMSRSTGKQRRDAAKKAVLVWERWWMLIGDIKEDSFLDALPVAAFEAGEMDKARRYATKLLELAARHDKSAFGDAIHKGNLVLGRIALKAGDIEKAKSYLLASGRTPGSPVLDSFGPNMTLAKELLEKGEQQTVLDYFALCAKFWIMDGGEKIKQWTKEVKAGKMPDFGANLDY